MVKVCQLVEHVFLAMGPMHLLQYELLGFSLLGSSGTSATENREFTSRFS